MAQIDASVHRARFALMNRFLAGGVFLLAFFSYLFTVAPTVCFWDCAEYTASCLPLQIPHPPGNPLYMLIGRVAGMALSFVNDPGLRLNLVSVAASATAAMLIYLIIARVFAGAVGIPESAGKRISIGIGGVVGALFAAFSSTVWFSSVEAEVNAVLLVPIMLCTWLVLVWAQSGDLRRDRLLVLITYIAFLGIGIHMYSMITLGPLFLYVIIVDREKRIDWRLWITAMLMGVVMYDISWFFWAGGGAVVVSLVMSYLDAAHSRSWRLSLFIAAAALMGFSVHFYLPVRSALNPMVDENKPEISLTGKFPYMDAKAFTDYLQRKQYGSESMISRMFWRRGTLAHQFGIEGHMGFGGFYLTQFFHFSPLDTERSLFAEGRGEGIVKLTLYLLPTLFMLFGMVFLLRRKRSVSVLLLALFLVTTVAMVFYMNFADGTKSERRDYEYWDKHGRQGPQPLVHREVRIRDYFYITGFAFHGMWVGIAAGGMLLLLYGSRKKFLRTTAAPIVTVLLAVSPALPFSQNMAAQSRRGDFVPFDYAWNILMSCEKEGIIFTNGDNDTFPLWALQEAYGIRRDVRVVNLSLLNTKWYIRQLRDLEPRVPITFTDAQLERVSHSRNPIAESTSYTLSSAGIDVDLPVRTKHPLMRIQDQMVIHIVDANAWRKPIYMAITVGDNNYIGLDPYLQMQGLAYRVMPRKPDSREKIDVGRSLFLLEKLYRFRGLGDGGAPLNPTSEKLLSNYGAAFLQVALALRRPVRELQEEIIALEKDPRADTAVLAEKRAAYSDTLAVAVRTMDRCVSLMPWDWRPRAVRHEFLLSAGRAAEAEALMRQALSVEPANREYKRLWTQALDIQGKQEESDAVIAELLDDSPGAWDDYLSMAQGHLADGNLDSAVAVMRRYASFHPADRRAKAAVSQLEEMAREKKGEREQ